MNESQLTAQLESLARGDPDALQRLIVHYHAILRAKVDGRIGPTLRPRVDADDVLQQAYVSAFEHVAECGFADPGGFYKWLETVALNTLRAQVRAANRQKRAIDREVHAPVDSRASYPNLIDRLTGADPTPSRQLARDEAITALMTSLARLTRDQREVVRRRFLEGQPVVEIAKALRENPARIYQLCHEGLTALRERMVSITRFMTR